VTSAAVQILVDCATAGRVDAARVRLHRRLAGAVDWEAVVEAAQRHGITPLVYQELRAAPDGLVSAAALATLKGLFDTNARRCLLLTGWLRRVVDRLAAAGVEAIPYKGPVLAALAYGSMAGRQAGDLDVLIDPRKLTAAKEALHEEGFRPVFPLEGWQERQLVRSGHPYAVIRDRARIVVELHWSVSPRSLSAGRFAATLRERLAEVPVGRVTFRTLPTDALLIALCVHGAKHVWERLGWIADVAELIARRPVVDWPGLLTRAGEAGHARELRLGLFLARDLLGAELPEAVSRELAHDPRLPALARVVLAQLDPAAHGRLGLAETARFHLAIRGTWTDRLDYCRFAMMPTVADWSAVSLPRWLAPLHVPLRIARLLRDGAGHHH
jgi:hypothetical protein